MADFLEDLTGKKLPPMMKKVIEQIKPSLWIKKLLMMLFMSLISSIASKIEDKVQEIKGKINKLKKLIKTIKKILKALKKFLDACWKILKAVAKLFFTFWVPGLIMWGIVFVVIVIVFLSILLGRFGGFMGEVVIDFDKMQEMNQDKDAYTDLLNTAALKESFYDEIANTSFYQTFNLTDLDGSTQDLSSVIVSGLTEALTGNKVSPEDVAASKKCVSNGTPSCVYSTSNFMRLLNAVGISLPQTDPRGTLSDASRNPAKYLIQAESLGTYSDSFGMTSYFRDYWNREETFQLNADFLYELNRWVYGTDALPSTEQIVYPEAFVKPVSFVNDFLRIQNDKTSNEYGKPYVYVTQRVTLDEIQDVNSQYYGKYEYEGLIKSLPSDIVYDYVIGATNSYKVENSTNSADSVNIGNPSQYVTMMEKIEYADGTYDYTKTMMKFYWVVNPLFMDAHMGVDIDSTNGTAFITNPDNGVYSNYFYMDENGAVQRIGNSSEALIGPFMDPVQMYVDKDEFAGDTIVFKKKMNERTSTYHSVANDNRSYTYKLNNPYIINNAFVTYDTSTMTEMKYFRHIVDYNKTLSLGNDVAKIYAGEVFYYSGEHYLATMDFNVNQNSMDPYSDDNMLHCVIKVASCVKVPYVVDYKECVNKGIQLYPGEVLRATGYWKKAPGFHITDSNAFYQLLSGGFVANVETNRNGLSEYYQEALWLNVSGDAITVAPSMFNNIVEDIIEWTGGLFGYQSEELKRYVDFADDNMYPRKHYQLTQIVNEDGEIVASSRNLINKTYLQKKTVRSYYRNSDEYWEKFADFTEIDKDRALYVGELSNLLGIVETAKGQCVHRITANQTAYPYEGLKYCAYGIDDIEDCEEDEGPITERKCSVISYITTKYIGADITSKISNFLFGEEASVEISAEAVYHILTLYEEWLIETGTEGVEWEYKYYSNTDADAAAAASQHLPSFSFFGVKIPTDNSVIARLFETDKEKYKDTFDSVVELNEERTVSTEYTPIAITSGSAINYGGDFYADTWGWKLVVDSSHANGYYLKKVYGETSYELPPYITATEIKKEVITDQVDNILNQMANTFGGGYKQMTGLLSTLFNNDYAEITYGAVNFAYKWNGDVLEYDQGALNDFYTALYLHANDLSKLNGTDDEEEQQDIRNQDEAWNQSATIYRPVATSLEYGTMQKYENAGRVTYKTEPDDYLAMELKSVRDYGLGSVLSYLEARKVTFMSGLAVSEMYDRDGVYAWIYSYYSDTSKFDYHGLTDKEIKSLIATQAELAVSGYYPSTLITSGATTKLIICPKCRHNLESGKHCDGKKILGGACDCDYKVLDIEYPLSHFVKSTIAAEGNGSGLTVDAEGNYENPFGDISEAFLPSDYAAIADGLNELQGTGESIFKYHSKRTGKDYWFTVTYAVDVNDVNTKDVTNDLLKQSQAFVLMMKQSPEDPDSKWIRTNINVAIPYVTELGLESYMISFIDHIAEKLNVNDYFGKYTDEDARKEANNQFFNPMGYYLAWYDFSQGNLTTSEQILTMLTREDIVKYYDNHTAASLRQIFNIQEACNLCDCAGIQADGCNCMCHDEFVSFKNLSNVKNKFWTSNRFLEWISDPKTLDWLPFGWDEWLQTNVFNVFDNAGSVTTSAIYEKFYEEYGDKVHVIDLLDDSKTSRVYIIEEAVTFLGNFIYTYDTEMLIAGDVYGNESIVSDIVFADRGYFISNYIFTVPVHVTTVVWSTEHTTEKYTIENYNGMTDEVIAQIYSDNPCATDKDQSGWEEFWNSAGNLFSGLFVVDDDFKELNDPYLTTNLAIKDMEGNPYKYCAANFSYKEDTDKKTIKYAWTYKFGSTVKVSDLNYTNAIYIDTVNEVNNVYQYLMNNRTASNGYESTATKLFIGLYVYENVNDKSFLWLNANTIDPIFAHTYTALEHEWEWSGLRQVCSLCGEYKSEATGNYCQSRGYNDDEYNPIDEDMYKWCVKDEDTTCISAAYGDTELHYGEYSRAIIAANGNNFFDTIGKAIAAIPTYIFPNLDLVNNLENRMGSLAGYNRIKNGKLVSSLGNEWWMTTDEDDNRVLNVDEDGNINDTGIDKSLDYIKMGATDEKYFELNEQDLKNIYYAICQVYAADYTNNNYAALNIADKGDNNTSAIELSSKPWGFTWNETVRGENQDAFLGEGHIDVESDTCYMDFYWKKNTIETKHQWDGWFMQTADKRHCEICGMCMADSTSDYCPKSMEGYYYLRGVQQTHFLSIPESINDNKMWLTMLVGINFGDRSMYGSPIALETHIYGSYRQIAPVQTGAYFNEEVYEDWTKRLELTDQSTEDKVNYVLTYKSAKKSYLYDYLTNFETYIPLGVMSDADLVNRGADAYQSLGNSDTRSYKYVSSYMGQIKKYIDNAGWISIIDNYNYKTPLLSGIISAIIPSYSSNEVDRDLMSEYVAGLIETTIRYAPTLTVDYYNGWGENIERSQDNYNRIEEKLYLSLFATSTEGDLDEYRKVSLMCEDGVERTYNMIYLGYGAILQTPTNSDLNALNNLTTAYVGGKDHEYNEKNICKRCGLNKSEAPIYCENAFPGFKDVTLKISSNHDDRLDMEKSLEYVSVSFGKLLTKYGNVCSATMAYFYGEEYWDEMLRQSVIEGISTGPEWHNDDWEIIQPALMSMRTFNLNNGLLQYPDYISGLYDDSNEELTKEMLTAEVVDYVLSYIADGNERLFLIRNTTSSLGSAVSSIGAKSEETKNVYEILTGDGMTVMFGTEDGDVAFEIKYDELAEMSRKLGVDMGVVMAILMAETNGNPCSGLGVCIATDEPGKYVMTKLIETRLNGYKTGLLGLRYNKKTQTVKYDKTERDIEQNCKSDTYGIESLWLHQDGDVTKENMCRTKVDTTFKTYSTSTIGRANGWPVVIGFANVNIEKITTKANEGKERWEKQYDRIYGNFAGEDGYIHKDNRFSNDGKDAIIYLMVTLANLYKENDNALEVLYTYYHSHSDLQALKNRARDAGYGSNWYAYYCKWTPDSVNLLKKTLEYYNGTINEDTQLEIEYPDKFVFSNSDKSGQTVIEKYFSVIYDKYVTESHHYYDEDGKKCQNTATGICTVVRGGKNDYGSDRCKSEFLETYVAELLAKNGKSVSNVAIKNIDLSNQGTVITTQYTFAHATIQPDQCDKVYQYYKGKDDLDGDSSINQFCSTDKLTVRTDFEVNIDMNFAYDEVTKNNWWNTGNDFIDWVGSIGGTHKEDNEAFVENLCLMSHPYAKELMASDYILQTEKWTKYAPSYDSSTRKCHTYAIRDGESQQLAMNLEYYDSSMGGVLTNILYLALSEGVDISNTAALEAYVRNNIYRVDQPMFKEETENMNVMGVPLSSQTVLTKNVETKYENVEVTFTNNEMGSDVGALIGYTGAGVSAPVKDWSESAKTLIGDCVFEYEYIDNALTTRDACATDSSIVVDNGVEYPVVGNSQYKSSEELEGKLWKCLVKPTLIIDYDTTWDIAISGFLVNAYSLFDDTSNYNKYTSNKLGMQNNGIMLFTDNKVTTPLMVDSVITASFATEDNFMVTVNDFSLFAFFESQIKKAEAPARSWISPIGLNEDTVGAGTTNDYTKNAVWDFPVLFKPQNTPTGKNNIVLIEQYGREPDLLNGGYKQNEGLVIEASRGDNVYAIMPNGAAHGQITNVGYNTIIGNFVEVTYTMSDDLIINSTTGESYKVSGIKIVYGYLLEDRYGGTVPTVGTIITNTNTKFVVGQVGTSGLSAGNQLYVSMRIKAEEIDLGGDTISQTGWLSVDMEPYFTSKYSSGAFNVYYE